MAFFWLVTVLKPYDLAMEERDVYIRKLGGTFFVVYAKREKGQRHSAAQFDCRDTPLEEVERFVRHNADLRLVDPPDGTGTK